MTIQEKFIAWMKDQGAWDNFVMNYIRDDGFYEHLRTELPIDYLWSAFFWKNTSQGYVYWENLHEEWLEYLENNK